LRETDVCIEAGTWCTESCGIRPTAVFGPPNQQHFIKFSPSPSMCLTTLSSHALLSPILLFLSLLTILNATMLSKYHSSCLCSCRHNFLFASWDFSDPDSPDYFSAITLHVRPLQASGFTSFVVFTHMCIHGTVSKAACAKLVALDSTSLGKHYFKREACTFCHPSYWTSQKQSGRILRSNVKLFHLTYRL